MDDLRERATHIRDKLHSLTLPKTEAVNLIEDRLRAAVEAERERLLTWLVMEEYIAEQDAAAIRARAESGRREPSPPTNQDLGSALANMSGRRTDNG